MRELSLHILDLAENSTKAGAMNITIKVIEDLPEDRLLIEIEDDGSGMDQDLLKKVTDPFVSTKDFRKSGLGIPLTQAAAELAQGRLAIDSSPGIGTKVTVTLQHSHIDRAPLGDLAATWLHLFISHPDVHWIFKYEIIPLQSTNGNAREFELDDTWIKEELEEITLTEPAVIHYLKNVFISGISAVQNG
ncbi:MAG: ATP-binding protein [Anaerolineaceae bacterium]|nr:ATP-binding protein [Anaerolineaceae bacterium]